MEPIERTDIEETTPPPSTSEGEVVSEEQAPAEAAPDAPPESEATEAAPTESVIPTPTWMRDLLNPQEETPETATEATPEPLDFSDTLLDEDAVGLISKLVEQKVGEKVPASTEEQKRLAKMVEQQTDAQIAGAFHNVHQSVYLDTFANDSALQGNEKAAQLADGLVREFMGRADFWARRDGNFEMLQQAQHPMFGKVIAAMVKTVVGASDAKPPVEIRGAEVESSTAGGKAAASGPRITAEIREALEKYGISEKQWLKDNMELKPDFSDYDDE